MSDDILLTKPNDVADDSVSSEQFSKDRESAIKIERGTAMLQELIAKHPVCLKSILEAIENSPDASCIVNYHKTFWGSSEKSPQELCKTLVGLINERLEKRLDEQTFIQHFCDFRLSHDVIENCLKAMHAAIKHGQISVQTGTDPAAIAAKAAKIASEGRDELLSRHKALVLSLAHKKGKALSTEDREDLRQEGFLGLLAATDRYNYRLGNCYMTFAYYRVRQNIDNSLSFQFRNVRLPVNKLASIAKATVRERILTQNLGRTPTDRELADDMEISMKELSELRILKDNGAQSKYAHYSSTERPDDEFEAENVADSDQKEIWQIINDEQNMRLLAQLLDNLKAGARTVIELRYALTVDEPMSRDQIGTILGVSRERIRQIEIDTLKKLARSHEISVIAGQMMTKKSS